MDGKKLTWADVLDICFMQSIVDAPISPTKAHALARYGRIMANSVDRNVQLLSDGTALVLRVQVDVTATRRAQFGWAKAPSTVRTLYHVGSALDQLAQLAIEQSVVEKLEEVVAARQRTKKPKTKRKA